MADNKKVTISICVSQEVANSLDSFASILTVSRSSVATAMLTIACRWCKTISFKEVSAWLKPEE